MPKGLFFFKTLTNGATFAFWLVQLLPWTPFHWYFGVLNTVFPWPFCSSSHIRPRVALKVIFSFQSLALFDLTHSPLLFFSFHIIIFTVSQYSIYSSIICSFVAPPILTFQSRGHAHRVHFAQFATSSPSTFSATSVHLALFRYVSLPLTPTLVLSSTRCHIRSG